MGHLESRIFIICTVERKATESRAPDLPRCHLVYLAGCKCPLAARKLLAICLPLMMYRSFSLGVGDVKGKQTIKQHSILWQHCSSTRENSKQASRLSYVRDDFWERYMPVRWRVLFCLFDDFIASCFRISDALWCARFCTLNHSGIRMRERVLIC